MPEFRRLCIRGLIPARAGKTYERKTGQPITAAHPRAGGENRGRLRKSLHRLGSSPRGRGKQLTVRQNLARRRLIPARAGKTQVLARAVSAVAAHPRAGGENHSADWTIDRDLGSSPRGRGKPRRGRDAAYAAGLIPARAGKTPARVGMRNAEQAHPRAGGENSP